MSMICPHERNTVCTNEMCELGCQMTEARKEIAAAGAPDYGPLAEAACWVAFWLALAAVLMVFIVKVGKLPW